jgi:DNA-binding NarL/FixJ family response regulator
VTRLLVLSHNAALALALAAEEYELVVLPPDATQAWRAALGSVDGVVFELDNPVTAAATLRAIRREGPRTPILAAIGDEARWDKVRSVKLPRVRFLQLPMSQPELVAAVRSALSAARGRSGALRSADEPSVGGLLRAARESRGLSLHDVSRRTLIMERTVRQIEDDDFSGCGDPFFARGHVRAIAAAVGLEFSQVITCFDAQVGTSRAAGLPGRPGPRGQQSATVAAPVRPRAPRQVDPRTPPQEAAPQPWLAGPVTRPERSKQAESSKRPAAISRLLVEPLPAVGRVAAAEVDQHLLGVLSRVSELTGVDETAEAVLTEAIERSGADAGCVLLPDASCWTICASAGLRKRENGARLPSDHWVVREVVEREHAFLVMDSDIARARLANAPLAAWRHLLAVPVLGVGGIILLARDKVTFAERDLQAVVTVAVEAAPLLTTAVLARRLARAIAGLGE